MSEHDKPRVRLVDGQVVLDDSLAVQVVDAIAKHNCSVTFGAQRERVDHFKRRTLELGRSPADTVIVLLNVNDELGQFLAYALMPGHDAEWAAMRQRGEIPFARGLAEREGIEQIVRTIDPACWERLRVMGTAVVVMDHGTVEAFEA